MLIERANAGRGHLGCRVDPEVLTHDLIVFATSQSESLRVRADQMLGGEAATIFPLVEQDAELERAAIAE
jgi:hypothetical protein